MAICLNVDRPFDNYKSLYSSKYFVDKSMIIESLNELIGTSDKYLCITKPRRFGKSSVADMLGAYYSKGVDSKEIFDSLDISDTNEYLKHLNAYNVIPLSFARINDNCKNCVEYVDRIAELLLEDLKEIFPELKIKEHYAIWDIFSELNEKFIFIFDEWDYIFNNNLFESDQNVFLEFLMKLLKDNSYVLLCYMTGILPIKRYSSGSALNMFDEFTMLNDMLYSDYFGFTEDEVMALCEKQSKINFVELREWYNGYLTEEGTKIYNPRSVVKALQSRRCQSYWTNTGAMNEVITYLKYNILEVRDDVIKMVAGETIDLFIHEEFRAGQGAPKTKEEIYSAMIILGFLAYHDGFLKIPNKEIMREFEKALKDQSFGYVSQIIDSSAKILAVSICYNSKTKEHLCKIEELI